MNKNESKLLLSTVIPVYNSALILPVLLEMIYTEMKREKLDNQFELLLINDASSDQSWGVICNLADKFSFVKGASLRRNYGQHNAIMASLNHASGEFVVIMDVTSSITPINIKHQDRLKGNYNLVALFVPVVEDGNSFSVLPFRFSMYMFFLCLAEFCFDCGGVCREADAS